MATFTRVRQGGTTETITNEVEERIKVIKRIVENKQYEQIDGQVLDLFSASAINTVYDALSEENKRKYSQLPTWKMAQIAFKLLK